jgi:signal peptidase I
MEKSMMVGDYLFVSKVAYGPKMPNTPIAFPFVHHTMPFSTTARSFSTVIQNPYRRLKGFGHVKNDDVVVFNFPEGDTVALKMQDRSYYDMVRQFGRERIWSDKQYFGDIIYRPVDKRENYIKRCIALPGDSLTIKLGQVYVNGKAQKEIPGIQYIYIVSTNGEAFSKDALDKLDITPGEVEVADSIYYLPLTKNSLEKLKQFRFIKSIKRYIKPADMVDPSIFPNDPKFPWNLDNYGPLLIPKKGATITLTIDNLPLYRRIIRVYEKNELEVKDGQIFINDKYIDPISLDKIKINNLSLVEKRKYILSKILKFFLTVGISIIILIILLLK